MGQRPCNVHADLKIPQSHLPIFTQVHSSVPARGVLQEALSVTCTNFAETHWLLACVQSAWGLAHLQTLHFTEGHLDEAVGIVRIAAEGDCNVSIRVVLCAAWRLCTERGRHRHSVHLPTCRATLAWATTSSTNTVDQHRQHLLSRQPV